MGWERIFGLSKSKPPASTEMAVAASDTGQQMAVAASDADQELAAAIACALHMHLISLKPEAMPVSILGEGAGAWVLGGKMKIMWDRSDVFKRCARSTYR